jgi:IPT/TIG domain
MGSTAGGTTVTIGGTGLSGATGITFGAGHPATGVSCTGTSCTATAPAEPAGTVDVQVTTAGGTSAASPADQYTYVTPFAFTGFFAPVRNPPAVNLRSAGQDVLLSFGLGGNQGLRVISDGSPTVQRVNCHTGAPLGPAAPAASDGFAYDRLTGRYVYQWQTSRRFAGTCQDFILRLTDGSTHTADFAFLI